MHFALWICFLPQPPIIWVFVQDFPCTKVAARCDLNKFCVRQPIDPFAGVVWFDSVAIAYEIANQFDFGGLEFLQFMVLMSEPAGIGSFGL